MKYLGLFLLAILGIVELVLRVVAVVAVSVGTVMIVPFMDADEFNFMRLILTPLLLPAVVKALS